VALLLGAVTLAASGCATTQKLTDAALGRGHREEREAERMQRVERAQHISEAQIERRLTYLTDVLDDNKLHAVSWQLGWMFIDSGGAMVSTGQAATEDDQHRAYLVMRAVKGWIGFVYLAVNPVPGLRGAEPIRRMPSQTREDKLNQLVAAEDLLAASAARSRQRFSWAYHIGNLLFNAAAAGAVYATGDHSRALQALLLDTAAGELQVWTQPWEPPGQWEEYERMVAADQGTAVLPRFDWRLVAVPGGIGVQARF
jgi:hypothetical protein